MTVLEIIRQIKSEKESVKIFPTYARQGDVRTLSGLSEEDFRKEVKELRDFGVIKVKRGINHYFLEIVEDV